jgi:hypothetical protein
LLKLDTNLGENELKMLKELRLIKSNIKENQSQINEDKHFLNQNEYRFKNEKDTTNLEDQEIVQIRYFLKNE